jgi:hypothetical protein
MRLRASLALKIQVPQHGELTDQPLQGKMVDSVYGDDRCLF